MPDLIDRHALLKNVYDNPPEKAAMTHAEWARKCIYEAPTIEAEPVRHGQWIDTQLPNRRVAKCSLCGFWQRTNGDDKTGKHLIHNAVYRYCAGCGARMDGGDDNGKSV